MSTHIEVSLRAENLLAERGDAASDAVAALLAGRRSLVQAGAFFPDWGYACADQSDAAEAAHWPPFWNATVSYISDTYGQAPPTQWSTSLPPRALDTIAFFYGVLSHGISDALWHSIGMDEGFIETMQHVDFRGVYSDAHSNADAGGDFWLARFNAQAFRNFESRWIVPVDDLVNIYDRIGLNVTRKQLHLCMLQGHAAVMGNRIAGRYLFPAWASQSPFLVEKYETYFRGGVDDMALRSTECWVSAFDWIRDGAIVHGCRGMGREWPPDLQGQDAPTSNATGASTHSTVLIMNQDRQSQVSKHAQSVIQTAKFATHSKLVELRPSLWGIAAQLMTRHWFTISPVHSKPASTSTSFLPMQHIDKMRVFTTSSNTSNQSNSTDTPQKPSRFSKTVKIMRLLIHAAFSHFLSLFRLWFGDGCMIVEKGRTGVLTTIESKQKHSRLGASIVFGDFDADGIPDLVIGAPGSTIGAAGHAGCVYVFYGRDGDVNHVPFSGYAQDTASLVLTGEIGCGIHSLFGVSTACNGTGARFGTALAIIDLNSDGIDDLAVSAPHHRAHAPVDDAGDDGRVYVFFGSRGRGLSPDSQPDVLIDGIVSRKASRIVLDAGFDVESFSLVSQPHAMVRPMVMSKPDSGSGSEPEQDPIPKSEPEPEPGPDQSLALGETLLGIDLDGDGHRDLVIGSPSASVLIGSHQRGMVQAFLSSSRHTGHITHQSADWSVSGTQNYEWFGKSIAVVSGGDDRDRDTQTHEYDHQKQPLTLVIGAPGYRPNATRTRSVGRIYVYDLMGTMVARPMLRATVTGTKDLGQFGATLASMGGQVVVGSPSETSADASGRLMDMPGLLVAAEDAGYQAGVVRLLDAAAVDAGDHVIDGADDAVAMPQLLHGSGSLGHLGAAMATVAVSPLTSWTPQTPLLLVAESYVDAAAGRVHGGRPWQCWRGAQPGQRLGQMVAATATNEGGTTQSLAALAAQDRVHLVRINR